MSSLPCRRLRPFAAVAFHLALAPGCATGRQGAPPGELTVSSPPRGRASEALAPVPGVERALGAGHVLERAQFVREVLRRNPSLESAQSGFRAALARLRQAGTFEDPMVEVGVAPLSVGAEHGPFG